MKLTVLLTAEICCCQQKYLLREGIADTCSCVPCDITSADDAHVAAVKPTHP